MQRLVTAAQMRSVDAAAIEQHGMPAAVLMENAGAALADRALSLAAPDGRFFVLCGRGNNGGDGLVAARRLHVQGRRVHVELVGATGARLSSESQRNLQALHAVGLSPVPIADELTPGAGDVVVDAVFGTGLARAPEGSFADAISRMRAWRKSGAKVVAADVPSGLHSDTGQPFDPCVEADATCAFGLLKVGQSVEPGRSLCGAVERVEIGIPSVAWELLDGDEAWLVEEADARARVPSRRAESHKGTHGHVLVVAGSWGKTGAAAMAGIAALRSGAGLCTVATRPEALVPVLAHAPELMGLELVNDGPLGAGDLNPLLEACDGKSAVVIGPGIPRGEETARLLETLLEELNIPVVLDADALNAIAQGRPGLLQRAQCPLVLTPHPGEMARLSGMDVPSVLADRMNLARTFAVREQVVLVLKGAATLTASEDGSVYVNPTGNPGLAKGGTGDVLAGVIGALLAQGLSPADAAMTGVFAHGLAADLAVARTGVMGLLATDLLQGLQDVWLRWGR